ncbi:kinase-like domain-containing protein, partial [Tribonema minus]
MTKGIQTTYNTITDRLRREATLAAADREARPGGKYNHGYDDKNFDYIAALPEEFGGRYVLLEAIGTGSFSKVYRARDLHNDGALVALKVVKSKAEFMAQAQAEVELLQRLLRHDPHGRHHCTRLLDSFWHRGHQCLVFELLHGSLYELLDGHNFEGFNLSAVRKFAWHVLTALAFLARPEVDVIHADIKPENIMLVHPDYSVVQVIDFGSSCLGTQHMYTYIQSRFYRSPEIVLGINYTHAIDMWSLGCMLVELHSGEPLFPAANSFDHVCRMVGVLGMPPPDVIAGAPHRAKFFEPADDAAAPPPPPRLRRQRGAATAARGGDDPGHDRAMYELFADFVARMLDYRAECRITPAQALNHPFM